MRRLFLSLAAFVALSGLAKADLIKQSAAAGFTKTFLLTQSANPLLGVTGITPVVKVRKQGGTYATSTNTATQVDATNDPGRYQIIFTTAEINTFGLLDIAITGTGANPESAHDQVVAFDPNDAVALGLTAVPASLTGTQTFTHVGNITGNLSGTIGSTQAFSNSVLTSGITTLLSGTATAGSNTNPYTITLASNSNGTNTYGAANQIKGNYVLITSGMGAGQSRTITGWDGTSLLTVGRAWDVAPNSTSGYAIIGNPHPVLDSNLAVVSSSVTAPVTLPTTAPSGYGGGVTTQNITDIAIAVFGTSVQGGLSFKQAQNLIISTGRDAARSYNISTRTAIATWYQVKADGTVDITKPTKVQTTVYDTAGQIVTQSSVITASNL